MPSPRPALTRDRVLRAALALADRSGLPALTMRALGRELGVEAMSLYHHVRGKDDVLDGLCELVVAEIDVPDGTPDGTGWRQALRRRSLSAHEVLLRHPWAALELVSRFRTGPATTAHLDATLGRLREAGFSVDAALDAWNLLDSHLYGFTLQELNLPVAPADTAAVAARVHPAIDAGRHPHAAEAAAHVARAGRTEDFASGLDLLLDGLEHRLRGGRA